VPVMPDNQSTTGDTVDLVAAQHDEIRSLFSQLEANGSADTLRSMRSAFETAERMAPTHPHPHGQESAIGDMAVGPFVAVVDKVGDALRPGKS